MRYKKLQLTNDEDRHSTCMPVYMIARVQRNNSSDMRLTIRMDEDVAAIEYYPYINQYWQQRFNGEMA